MTRVSLQSHMVCYFSEVDHTRSMTLFYISIRAAPALAKGAAVMRIRGATRRDVTAIGYVQSTAVDLGSCTGIQN